MDYRDELTKSKFSTFIASRTQIYTHSHNFLELAYVLKGEAIHTLDDNVIDIKEGDYFCVDYRSKHSYKAKSQEFALLNCLFLPEFIDASLINCRSLQTLISNYQIHFKNDYFTANPSMSIFNDDNKRIKNLLLTVLQEYTEKAPGYLQIIRSQVIEVLILTMRKIYADPAPDVDNSDIEKILNYIRSQYMHNLRLRDICKEFGYSFSYLSAKFKKETGMNFTQYLQKIRIEQSMRLLAHTDKSISAICNKVGYANIKSYYAVFRKIANTTPAKFRKKYFGNI